MPPFSMITDAEEADVISPTAFFSLLILFATFKMPLITLDFHAAITLMLFVFDCFHFDAIAAAADAYATLREPLVVASPPFY